jgi:hypothetical protein
LRKVIRLLKSLKYDEDTGNVSLSSYDITGICYHMPESFLRVRRGEELLLVRNAEAWLSHLEADEQICFSLDVPNATRKIFCIEGAQRTGLQEILREVRALRNDIENGLARSFKKLADARVYY